MLQTFNNDMFEVSVKQEDNKNLFDAESVAISLGFTQTKNGKLYVRWETVNNYLKGYISQNVGKGDFLPEQLVYKLGFKSGNSTAEKFQDWLAFEVLPTLRNTGVYQTSKPLTTQEQIQLIALGNTELDERVTKIEESYPIMPGEAKHIQSLVARKVAEVVRNKFNGHYKEVSRKLFSEIYKSIKKVFDVPSYNLIPRGRYKQAIEFVERWQPSFESVYQLEMDLKMNNEEGAK